MVQICRAGHSAVGVLLLLVAELLSSKYGNIGAFIATEIIVACKHKCKFHINIGAVLEGYTAVASL
ncbi:MAG: hypothetical protein PV344_06775, partial [Anaplasma sp.]|nr:hypothetical protein [Anaplasma sp.]